MLPRGLEAKKKGARGNKKQAEREKKSSKNRKRKREGAPKEFESHGSLALSVDYDLPRSPRESRKSSQRAPEELLGSQHGTRRGMAAIKKLGNPN